MTTIVKMLGFVALVLPAMAADLPSEVTLFKNVNIFDGTNERLLEGYDVLVVRNLIKQVARNIPTEGTYEIDVKTGGVKRLTVDVGCMHHYTVYVAGEEERTEKKQVTVNVIDGKGKTLMPGLIDAHWHTMYVNMLGLDQLRTEETDYIHAVALEEAEKTLLRGFTTVRDLGGSCFGLKKAIDEGVCSGPRVLPSGTHIGITGGHADYTERWNLPRMFDGSVDRFEQIEAFRQVAGVDEMLAAVRFNLKRGACQIKLLMGGGVASTYDPLDVDEFTFEEVKAAVDVARNWGTYVTVHIYTDEGIKKAIKAGVKGVEHGHLMSEEAAKMMAQNDMWLCIQAFDPDMPGALEILGPEKFKKYLEMANGFPKVMGYVKKYNINLAFGTDFSFTPQNNHTQANNLAKYTKWLSNYEILKMATSTNAQYLDLSGERHPYKAGPLGVIKPGAYADILLVDGNPLQDVSILGDDGKNIPLVMKDGRIYKNTLK